jgi:hypothetical protein
VLFGFPACNLLVTSLPGNNSETTIDGRVELRKIGRYRRRAQTAAASEETSCLLMLRIQCINTNLPFSTSLTALDILPVESPIDLTTQDTGKRQTHHQLTPHQHNTETITMSQTQQPFSAAGRLRQLLSDSNHTVVAPGVYDGISARLALAQGFECLYMVCQILWQLATFLR